MILGHCWFFLHEVAVFHANLECVCLMTSLVEFHRKHANRPGWTLMALLRVRHIQWRTVILAQVMPVDFLARLELDLFLPTLARDLGERRPLCWVLAPTLCDGIPERFLFLRERQPPIQERDVLDDLVGI
jgi:hypothetical protein